MNSVFPRMETRPRILAQLATVKCFSHSAFREEPGPSHSPKRTYEQIPASLMMSVCRSLHDGSNFAMLTYLLRFLINVLFTVLPSYFCWLSGKPDNKSRR